MYAFRNPLVWPFEWKHGDIGRDGIFRVPLRRRGRLNRFLVGIERGGRGNIGSAEGSFATVFWDYGGGLTVRMSV